MKIILIRYGEIALKSPKVRKRFEIQLENNIKYALDDQNIPYKIHRLPLQGRIFVETDFIQKSIEILSNVFGIVSISPVLRIKSDLDSLLKESLKFAKSQIKQNNSFAIRVRRSGNHNYTSQDIANQVGAEINEKMKDRNIKVDLTNPDSIIYIEIRDEWAYIFNEIIDGIGGFPYHTQDKLVSIFFGDFNSFFSSWLMLRKGCIIIPIFYDFSAILNNTTVDKVVQVVKYLKKYINTDKFYIYKIPDCKDLIESKKSLENCNKLQINLQLLYLIAEKIAIKEKAQGIVSYYTFSDIEKLIELDELEKLIKIPIYRPCLGYDMDSLQIFKKKFDNSIFIDRKSLKLNLKNNGKSTIELLIDPQIVDLQSVADSLLQKAEILNYPSLKGGDS